jgi:hypothetical protein
MSVHGFFLKSTEKLLREMGKKLPHYFLSYYKIYKMDLDSRYFYKLLNITKNLEFVYWSVFSQIQIK